jgi:DNA-binding NtrC family response regulator
VTRVGDTKPEPVDVRILAATNRDLLAEIRAGRFREDLYYRLNVVQIQLPPLRERGDDVLILSRYFLRRFAEELHVPPRTLSAASEQALRKHPWPGNIRQLENHIKKALVLGDREVLEPEDLGLTPVPPPLVLPLAEARERFSRQYITETLAHYGGNRTRTAQALGIDPRTLFRFLAQQRSDAREDGASAPSLDEIPPGEGDPDGTP